MHSCPHPIFLFFLGENSILIGTECGRKDYDPSETTLGNYKVLPSKAPKTATQQKTLNISELDGRKSTHTKPEGRKLS